MSINNFKLVFEMKKTSTQALLFALLSLGASVTSCKKNDVDLTPYKQ